MPSKATIQKVRSLQLKKFRDEYGLFIAEGDKLVAELLASTFEVKQLFTTEHSQLVHTFNVEKDFVTADEMKRMSGLKTPSDSLAVVKIPVNKLRIDELANGITIMLDGIQDPGNLGTIIRLADWFGIGKIICSENTVSCYNPKVVQATMGAISRVNMYYTPLIPLLSSLPDTIPTYGTFLNGCNIYESKLSEHGIIVMGNEGKGVTEQVEQLIQQRLYIPSFSENRVTSESLNVAVATAIVCSEFKRRFP